jgi:hypothetical protein
LAADDQPGVDLVGDVSDRLGHRLVRFGDSRDRVVAARPSSRGALLGDPLSEFGFLFIDLALVRYGDHKRARSGQLHRCGCPHGQHHGIAGRLDPFDCGSQSSP